MMTEVRATEVMEKVTTLMLAIEGVIMDGGMELGTLTIQGGAMSFRKKWKIILMKDHLERDTMGTCTKDLCLGVGNKMKSLHDDRNIKMEGRDETLLLRGIHERKNIVDQIGVRLTMITIVTRTTRHRGDLHKKNITGEKIKEETLETEWKELGNMTKESRIVGYHNRLTHQNVETCREIIQRGSENLSRIKVVEVADHLITTVRYDDPATPHTETARDTLKT
jgi:hypothetical protein